VFKSEEQLKKEIVEAFSKTSNLTNIAKQVGTSFYKVRNVLNSSLTSKAR
jgi:hypothetical protein